MLLAIGLAAFVGAGSARAQTLPSGAQVPGAGYKVGTITIKFVGTANVNEQVVRANMQLHEGGDLDDALLDRDIRNLYKTGLFEFIQTKWEPAGPRTFNLVVEVTPKLRVLAINYVGNKKVTSKRLGEEVKTKPNTALDEHQVKEDSEKIRDYYQKIGYNQVSVTYRIDKDRSTGLGTVVFEIKEGAKVRIANVLFIGNNRVKSSKLRSEMDTRRWWIFSWLTESGRFKDNQFQDDLGKLRDYYQDHGYLDIDIPEDKVVFDYPRPGRMIITLMITEGRQYHIGEISFTGNKVHSSALLKRVVRQKTGMVFSPSKLDKDVERLEDFYGRDGYLNEVEQGTRVHAIRKPNLATGNIDIEFDIEEGQRFNVESIVIEGNTKSKSTVILRELVLGPGDVFDSVRMKISKLRLENTRFFDDVDMKNQPTNIPGRENMRVAVKEGHTGQLTFGAGYSTLEGADIFAEIAQTNFDLFNARSLFVGDGQKFRVRIQLGQLSSEAIISFEEPYVAQKPLALGFSLFRTSIGLREHLVQRGGPGRHGRPAQAPLRADPGPARLHLRGGRNPERLDLRLRHHPGRRRQQSGVEGQSPPLARHPRQDHQHHLRQPHRAWTPRSPAAPSAAKTTTTASISTGRSGSSRSTPRTRCSSCSPGPASSRTSASTTVPYYDAFYLGGPDDLRGFQYRFVSPRDIYGEPIGGKTSGMFSAEYSADIVSPIRFALFYDAGIVNPGSFDFSINNYQDDFGVGLRLFVMGAPLSLDYGIPIRGDDHFPNKTGNQFNFSFGTRF